MLNVLLIANQQRLQQIVAAAVSATGVSLRIAPNFGECGPEISAAAPDVVFIQNRLSGLSADILYRHIKSLISDASVTVVLLSEDSASDPLGGSCIETTGPDEDIRAAVERIITSEIDAACANRKIPALPSPAEAPKNADSAPEDSPVQNCLTGVDDTVSLAGNDTFLPAETVRPAEPIKFHEELDSLMGKPAPPPVESEERESGTPLSGPTVDELLGRANRPTSSRSAVAIAVILVVIAATIVTFTGGRKQKETVGPTVPPPVVATPAEKAPAPSAVTPAVASPAGIKTDPPPSPAPSAPLPQAQLPQPAIRKTALPSFVPKRALVEHKGAGNGVWDKYVTPAAEYRVFREGQALKAVQVIDRTGKGITRAFFTRAIDEMAGVKDYNLQSREMKGDVLIKKGTLSGNARVILYKRNADTFLQAFVIQYD